MDQTFCVSTNCCAVQRNETYRIAKFFRLNGWNEVNDPSEANINVITTCGVTDITEKDSFSIIEGIVDSKRADGIIVISGCLPNICIDKLMYKYPDVYYVPLDNMALFDDIINATIKISDVYFNSNPAFHHSKGDPTLDSALYDDELRFAKALSKKYNEPRFLDCYDYATQGRYLWKDESIFEVKISSGCTNECSYCASRLGIGNYRSKSLAQIEKEIKLGHSLGYTKVMLMGDELGAYGSDIGCDFLKVLELCFDIDPNIEVGIRYIHPDYLVQLYPKLKKYFKNIFFLCVSLQSASPKVLKLMNRNEKVIQEIRPILKDINENYLNVYLHTQIIIGFPNEESEDFDLTLSFLKEFKFDFIRYNAFSARKGTKAYSYPVEYSADELKERMCIMKEFVKYNRYERLYSRYQQLILSQGENQ